MRLLIDTQIFIWWDSEPNKLPLRLLQLCEDEANTLVVSIASIWEIQIKTQIGKLDLNRPLDQIIRDQQNDNQIALLSVEVSHVFGLQHLPLHHKDPFDRLIIAQALVEQLPLISVDAVFTQYPVHLIN